MGTVTDYVTDYHGYVSVVWGLRLVTMAMVQL